MTPAQKRNYNKMRACLRAIWKGYYTPAQLRKESEREYGLDFVEALEMSYENIQGIARSAVSGIKEIK